MKHIFVVQPSHPLCIARLLLIAVVSAPSIRSVHIPVTNTLFNIYFFTDSSILMSLILSVNVLEHSAGSSGNHFNFKDII
jgi:hypothetical protein